MIELYKLLIDKKIIRSDGRLNSAVIRRDDFKSSSELNSIIDATSFLSQDASLGERLFCIKNNILIMPICKCGSPLKWESSATSYSKTCGEYECSTTTENRVFGKNKISKTKLKDNLELFSTFVKKYTECEYKQYSIDDILKFIDDNYNSIVRHGIFRDYQLKHNSDMLCSIVRCTEKFIPVVLTKVGLRLNERSFMIKTRLSQIPNCDKCNSAMLYKNFKEGYTCRKKACYINSALKIKHKNKQEIVTKILSKNGFTLKTNYLLNAQQATLHCSVCDQDFDYWIRNGKADKVVCPKCHCKNEEESLFTFIKSIYDGEIIRCYKMPWTKNKTAYQELDVYLPELKIAFEYDGIYWHSDIDKNYHLNKTESCLANDIKLYHIFSNEWTNPIKQTIWKSIIASTLNKSNRIFARKCEIVTIDKPIEFLIENHLQGNCNSSIAYGLQYDGKLVCLATFGKARYSKQYDYELLRFCNKLNVNVIGGFSRLLTHFRKIHKGSIVTYADRRLSFGNVYNKNNFKFSHASRPNYFYWKGEEWHSRDYFQKHKLSKLLEKFDQKLTELENMRMNGWHQIHDCGNLVYMLEK